MRNKLTKYYGRLARLERFGLILLALSRADWSEAKVLLRSDPRPPVVTQSVYTARAEGLALATLCYVAEQLQAGLQLMVLSSTEAGPDAAADQLRLRLIAFQIVQRKASFACFCEGLHVDADIWPTFYPHAASLHAIEECAEQIPCTPAEAACLCKQINGEQAVLPTVEERTAAYRSCLGRSAAL